MQSKSKSYHFKNVLRHRPGQRDSASLGRPEKEGGGADRIEELQQAEKRYRQVKMIEDSQHCRRLAKLAASKRIKTEGEQPCRDKCSDLLVKSHSNEPLGRKQGVSIKKIDFSDSNEVQELEKRLNALIAEKLSRLSKALKSRSCGEGEGSFYGELSELIRRIRRLGGREGGNEIALLNKKIEYIQSLMAENTTELDLIKKYYYYCSSNKKRNAIGRFLSHGPRIFKAIRAQDANRTEPVFCEGGSAKARPFFGVATSKEEYQAPRKEFYQLQRSSEQPYCFNAQPLPRSSYRRDFLNISAMPIEPLRSREERHRSPNYTTTFKTRYALDFQPLQTASVDYKQLDAYQDKLKFLEVSYASKPAPQPQPEPRALPALAREESAELSGLNASVRRHQRCFDRHRFVTESQKSYGWSGGDERSRIKHQQLRQFQYRLKSLYKS